MNKEELLKKAKPILLYSEDVQAILDNRKTKIRRIVRFKGARTPNWTGYIKDGLNLYNGNNEICNEKPQYGVGDILYERETRLFLRITDVKVERLQDIITGDYKTPLNINAEGLYEPCCRCTHVNGDCKDFIANGKCRLIDEYKERWNKRFKSNPHCVWNANPWTWVYSFEKIEVK